MRPLISLILSFHIKDNLLVEKVTKEFEEKINKTTYTYEIIIVVNGCVDLPSSSTFEVIREQPLITEHRIKDTGWGRSVRWGLNHAKGEYLCYTNSARTNGDELIRVLHFSQVDRQTIVKATRTERTNKWRRFTSIIFNILNRIVLKTPIWDVNATPKVIPRHIFNILELHSNGDLIDAELMFEAYKKKIPIVEIPIQQTVRKAGKSTTNWKSALMMFIGIFEIKRKKG